jgi:hypothetical protein
MKLMIRFDVGEDLVSHEETQVTEVDTSTAGLAGDSMAPVEEDLKQQHQEYVRYQEDELSRLRCYHWSPKG